MRPINPAHRRRSSIGLVLLILGILIAAPLATVAALWAAGIELPFGRQIIKEDTFVIRIPNSTRPIAAYSRVARADMLDPATRWPKFQLLPPRTAIGKSLTGRNASGEPVNGRVENVEETEGEVVFILAGGQEIPHSRVDELGGAILNINNIIGRVVKQDKSAGIGFSETNFFPQGTREGIAGATPPGMRALTLPAERLIGVHSLQRGDTLDMVASIPVDQLDTFDASQFGASVNTRPRAANADASEARTVAQDAVVLLPVSPRSALRNSSPPSQSPPRGKPVEEVVIAFTEDDVPIISEALEMGGTINCLVQSGRPETSDDSLPEGMVEVPLSGRTVVAYSAVRASDLVNPKNRKKSVAYLPAEDASSRGLLLNESEIVDRVLRQDKAAGEFFREEDFLPAGSPEGIASAVPQGKRIFFLDADKVDGAEALSFGQHFDLLASVPIELSNQRNAQQVVAMSSLGVKKQHRVEPIVHDGVVIAPVGSPANPTFQRDDPKSNAQQVVIAVAPSEVAILQQRFAMEAAFRVVLRGASQTPIRSDDVATTDVTPGIDPFEDARLMEAVVGSKRKTLVFAYGQPVFDSDAENQSDEVAEESATQ